MKRVMLPLSVLFLAYLATGFYAVRGNEQAVVRRFGKVVRNSNGTVLLRKSGLHYDWPFPFSKIDRVNFNEVQTVSIGSAELEALSETQPLKNLQRTNPTYVLTGDKNILNVKLGIQYRVSAEQVDRYLFHVTPAGCKKLLQTLAESVLTDLVTRSGVDFMQTHGRSELQRLLTEHLRDLTQRQRLGIRIDTINLEKIEPPLRVRAAFLDVNDARSQKQKYINAALAYAAERREAARAERQSILDEAEIYRQQTVELAKAEVEGIEKLLDRIAAMPKSSQATLRRMILARLYLETMETVLGRVKRKIVLESNQPIDLTLPPHSDR
ncbi:MAG: hypothetical protein Tsb009_20580 [Planctomycetaceae bacterium]